MKRSFKKMIHVVPIVMTLMGGAVIAQAVQITPSSYNMPNGDGVASYGEYNYWDTSYTGSGSTTTDGASLSGGLGKLTNGVIATHDWEYLVSSGPPPQYATLESAAGTGPYVGWVRGINSNPTIVFNFANPVNINTISFYVDNPLYNQIYHGGVGAPSAFTIGGTTYKIDDSSLPSGVVDISLTNLGLTDISSLSVTIFQNQNPDAFWLFLSQVTFDDGTPAPVPEPASLILFGAGIAAVALLKIRRKKYTCEHVN